MVGLLLAHERDRDQLKAKGSVQSVVNNVAKVLNQASRSKLAYLAVECLAVLHHRLGLSLLTMLQNSTINANDMATLRRRFKAKARELPVLDQAGNLSFRHQSANLNSHANHNRAEPAASLQAQAQAQAQVQVQHSKPSLKRQHSKPSRNPSASRKIPFLSATPLLSGGESQSHTHDAASASPCSLRSEPLLQRRSLNSDILSVATRERPHRVSSSNRRSSSPSRPSSRRPSPSATRTTHRHRYRHRRRDRQRRTQTG